MKTPIPEVRAEIVLSIPASAIPADGPGQSKRVDREPVKPSDVVEAAAPDTLDAAVRAVEAALFGGRP